MIASFIGENGSGKSCLVNLILGEEILPHSALSLTSTICEVKYGEQRRIVAHLKDKDPETGLETKSIFLEQQPGSSEQSYIWHAQIYSYASDPAFKKIELFWPHSLLQVVIAENCLAQSIKHFLLAIAGIYAVGLERSIFSTFTFMFQHVREFKQVLQCQIEELNAIHGKWIS